MTDYEIVDRLFGPNDLKGLGLFAALGGPQELREWLRERIAPKVEALLLEASEGAALPEDRTP